MSKTTKTARQRLREWRGDRMLTHVEDEIGIDATTLGKIEAGKYIPGEAMRWRIVNKVGIPIDAWPPRPNKREVAESMTPSRARGKGAA